MPHTKPNFQRFVDRLTGRSVLTAEEQQSILDLPFHARQVHSNEDFVAFGETVDHANFIVDGFVGRFDQNYEGKRQITAIHIPGDMADLHSLVQPAVTSALQALSVATICACRISPCEAQLRAFRRLPKRCGGIVRSMPPFLLNGS